MKVLLANKFFFLNGGSERVFFQERDFLIRNGVEVIDFSMEDPRNFPSPYADYFVSHIDYHNTGGIWNKFKQAAKFVHSPEAIHKLEKLIKDEKPDIAHLHNIYHQLTPSIITTLKNQGVKVVLTLHDSKLICPSYLMLAKGKICTVCEGRSFWKPLAMNCVNSRAQELLFMVEAYWHKWAKSYGQVDLFLSPSRFLAELVSKRVPSTKIRQLRNGVDLTTYRLSPGDQGYALYFGRLSREKGIETLLRAHENLRNGTDLRVIGTGPLETELREKYSHVQFLGYKEGEELKTLVANAAFVVVPSECYENCPMTVLEAMAYGKAVIGSNIGGVPEQIEDGKSGFLFEQGNAHDLRTKMTILIQDRTLRQDMGKAGRKIIEQKFSLNKHCSELLTIYEDLISH